MNHCNKQMTGNEIVVLEEWNKVFHVLNSETISSDMYISNYVKNVV